MVDPVGLTQPRLLSIEVSDGQRTHEHCRHAREGSMNPGRKRILVLDTDPELLISLEQILEDGGYATTTTWDTGESLDLLDSKSGSAAG